MKKHFEQKLLFSALTICIIFGTLIFLACSGCSSSSSSSPPEIKEKIETPVLVPLPDVVADSSIIIRGRAVAGADHEIGRPNSTA